jgi:iron complex outermembrane receptor protein
MLAQSLQNSGKHGVRRSAVALAVAAALASAVVHADESASGALEEVVVTARKRAENVQDVPIPVTAFGGETLADMGFRNLGSIAAYTPSLQINRDSGGDSAMIACMRGLCRTDTILTEDPLVGIYIDGFYVPKAEGALFDLIDVQSVEVLRGPQGTLFGKNTLGGAINVTSKAPSGQFGGSATLEIGSDELRSGRFTLDLPLLGDVLAAKISYLKTERDGLVEDTAGRDMKDIDHEAAAVTVRLEPNESFTADYTFDWYQARQGLDIYQATYVEPGVDLILPGISSTASDTILLERTTIPPGGYDNLDMRFNGLTLTWDVSDSLTLKSLTGYRNTDGDTFRLWSPYVLISGRQLTTQEFFSQELQALGSLFDERLQYVAGVFYSDEEGTFDQQLAFGALTNGTLIDLAVDNSSIAVFGEVTYDITDKFSITGGARYTDEQREADLVLRTIDGSSVIANVSEEAPTNEFDTSDVAPRLSVQYRPADDVMGYLTYTRGFKSGGLNGRANSPAEFTPYDDTTMDSYEIGVKSQFMDRRLQINASYYYSKADDLQVQINSFDPDSGAFLTQITNAGKATIQGVEVEAHARPVNGLQVGATVSYTDPEYDEFLAFNGDFQNPGLVNVADQRNFQFTPEWTYSLSARYEHEVSDSSSAAGWIGFSYVGDQYFQVVPSDRVAGHSFALLDARLEWSYRSDMGELTVSLWGKNLSDEVYRTGGFDIPTFGLPGGNDGIGFNSYGDPRTYGVSFRYDWGSP